MSSQKNKKEDIYKVSEESRKNSINLNAAFMASLFPSAIDDSNTNLNTSIYTNHDEDSIINTNSNTNTNHLFDSFPFLYVNHDKRMLVQELKRSMLRRDYEIDTILNYVDKVRVQITR